MGMFDFLKGKMTPQAGGTVAPIGERDHTLQLPPTMQKQPGFFGRMAQPDAHGVGFKDRALMAMLALQGETGAALQMRQGMHKEHQDKAERQSRNDALKGAYRNGKFDHTAFLEARGGSGDMAEDIQLANALKPERKVISNTRGIYEVGDEGVNPLHEFPDEPENAPSGFRWKADGSGLELIPGYEEGIGRIGGVRREAVVSRPMPRAGGRGGAGKARSYDQDEVSW